jgi:hypothetical protein
MDLVGLLVSATGGAAEGDQHLFEAVVVEVGEHAG